LELVEDDAEDLEREVGELGGLGLVVPRELHLRRSVDRLVSVGPRLLESGGRRLFTGAN
jgi:hypothetical protein